MQPDHPYWHANERKYFDLQPHEIPVTESLADCIKRSTVLWNQRILPDLRSGKNVLVMAHANSLRGMVQSLGEKCSAL